MKLFLVQHGEARAKDADPDRPLSEKGREDIKKTAEFLKKTGQKPDLIWHSSKTRAIQSAEIISLNQRRNMGRWGGCVSVVIEQVAAGG